MVSFMGLMWREDRRDMTWPQWRRNRENFILHFCQRWSLTSGLDAQSDDGQPVCKRFKGAPGENKEKLIFRGSMPAADELTDTVAGLVTWGRMHGCLLYVTDSKSLQEVLCGTSVCLDSHYEPLLTRVLDRFIDHLRCKWIPPHKWADPVAWMPRCHNKVADGLADYTMDRRSSWNLQYETTLPLKQSNIIVQTDGGLREEGCAAASWIIGLWDATAHTYEPYGAGGVFLNTRCTVFMAEAIAIDEASAHVKRFLEEAA